MQGLHGPHLSHPGKVGFLRHGMQSVQSWHLLYIGQSAVKHAAQPIHGSHCLHWSHPSPSGWSIQWIHGRQTEHLSMQALHGENISFTKPKSAGSQASPSRVFTNILVEISFVWPPLVCSVKHDRQILDILEAMDFSSMAQNMPYLYIHRDTSHNDHWDNPYSSIPIYTNLNN